MYVARLKFDMKSSSLCVCKMEIEGWRMVGERELEREREKNETTRERNLQREREKQRRTDGA